MLRRFKKSAESLGNNLAQTYGAEYAREVRSDAIREFEALIPVLPYFGGGSTNPFNFLVVVAARMVAFHRPMKARGKTAEDTILIFYDYFDDMFAKTPGAVRWLARKFIFSGLFLSIMKRVSGKMTRLNDPDGFEFSYHKGDGISCDWYFTAKRCGLVTFLEKQDCGELAPYCNLVDYIQSKALGMGVQFKSCLGAGDPTCEECMKEGRPTEMPPLIAGLLARHDESS